MAKDQTLLVKARMRLLAKVRRPQDRLLNLINHLVAALSLLHLQDDNRVLRLLRRGQATPHTL